MDTYVESDICDNSVEDEINNTVASEAKRNQGSPEGVLPSDDSDALTSNVKLGTVMQENGSL